MAALPADVLAAVEGVSVLVRSSRDEIGLPRAIITWPSNGGGWVHGVESTPAAVRHAFPDLDDKQVERAARALAGIVEARTKSAMPNRRNWVHDY